MITGSEASTRPYSENAVEKVGENAEIYTINGAIHADLYDKDAYVTPSVNKLTEFFEQHLVKA